MRTQVAILGAGPAGLTLAQMLHQQGISCQILELRDRAYVEHRVRAGVLEHGTVTTLHEIGAGSRLATEGLVHTGTELRFHRRRHRIDFHELSGRTITVYGQQEVVKDLIAMRLADLRFEVSEIRLAGLDSAHPRVSFRHGGAEHELDADIVVGADGFHGISREHLPAPRTAERRYGFSWLGILAETAPSSRELIYCRHERGFALHSMRSPAITRLYLQVPADTELADWPDDRVWSELATRLQTDDGFTLIDGPVLDKGITPMRSVVTSPMQEGRLYLAGDAAHIVPPTGAKGMNLAIADVRLLSYAIGEFYATGSTRSLDSYTEQALRRVWRATHFSWWMTTMLHVEADSDDFGSELAAAQLDYLASSQAMATVLAENYTGLPYERDWYFR
jgi:p-hydroxybenzoate 3-monooxygenase